MREIGWTHNLIVLEKCKDPLEREFYIRMTRKFGWTKDVLGVQIDKQAYEKTVLNQTNFARTVPAKYRDQAKLAVRDDYTFDFLELGEEHSERELERAIVEYALRESNKPIGVATYQILKRLPKSLADQLPQPKQIEALMMDLEQELQPKGALRSRVAKKS